MNPRDSAVGSDVHSAIDRTVYLAVDLDVEPAVYSAVYLAIDWTGYSAVREVVVGESS
jgi:hypothetical protein